MKLIEARIIQAIRFAIGAADLDGRVVKCGNTEVTQTHTGIAHTPGYQREIHINLHSNEIAVIRPIDGTIWVSDCGWRTAVTRSRINVLIRCLTLQAETQCVVQRDKAWYHCVGNTLYPWRGTDTYHLSLSADNPYLQQAEHLAG